MSERKNPEHRGRGGQDPGRQDPAGQDSARRAQERPGEPGGTADALPAQRDDTGEVIATRRGMFGAGNGGDTSGYGGLVRTVRLPGASQRPYGGPGGDGGGSGDFDEIADELEGALDEQGLVPENVIEKTVVDRGELTFHIARESLPAVARILRDDPALRFELCTGVSGVHFPGDQGRELHAVYHLRSITHNRLIRLEVSAPDADPHIPSLVGVYPTNDWHERETYDFFGLIFDGHPALTRIMMPDDWQGFPQRKDYPLGGIPVEYKGARIPAPDQRRSYS
ncbi:NAD(P)H-quinone oxidoreductase subunit J [Streptomyces sp. NBRC 110611]|uniref:NADH-quinone oxidoreductase subunit C n=1 Tax=Streptomyces sp. NBRC 110611 TaxID=1621259 RepID=UPI000856CA3C|nr:NADH-quinone oxidoreductase subunit C [Streptomyces sp. NBRC 110611]GAU67728.1 NAD(P)H-quinone oxidoreductase subunit J [Streptomyces sp. NBRC 110611]